MNHPLAAPEFLLANVGPGPDPCSLAALGDAEFVVLAFLRDFHCDWCRKQVRTLADRYDDVRSRGGDVRRRPPRTRGARSTVGRQIRPAVLAAG